MSTIVSLNGDWEFLWDSESIGFSHRWYVTVPEGLQQVQVPHLWEQAFAKPGQVAFYFKRFTIDASENSKRIYLRFERIAMQATIWLNGKYLGEHFGAYSEFQLETAKAIKVGEENLLVIRVSTGEAGGKVDLGRADDEGTERFAPAAELPVGQPWLNYPFAGIFGNVDLILGNRAMITSCVVTPNLDAEKLTLDLSFANPRNYLAKLRIIIVNPSGEASELHKEVKLEKENFSTRIQLGFKELETWTPERPRLYKIEVCLDKSFSVVRNFAFRKFDCLKGDFFLNDKVIRLQGLIYSQHNPDGGVWNQMADLKKIKSLGFNVIRSGGAPLSEQALNLCDELGIMVFQEFPIHTQRSSTKGLDKVRLMTEELIQQGKSHPSIVAWVLGSENGTMMLENGTKLLKNVDQFDQTRPVFSNLNSVYLDHSQGFKRDTGKVMGVTQERISLYPSHRLHLRMLPNQTLSMFLGTYCSKDLPDAEVPDLILGDSQFQEDYQTFVTEQHGKILITLRNHNLLHDLAKTSTRLKGLRATKNQKALQTLAKQINAFVQDGPGKGLWKDVEEFRKEANSICLRSKLDQINALQSNPQVSGFFLDQWADYGTELSGLVTEMRESKGVEDFCTEVTRSTRLLISALERSVKTKGEIGFILSMLNDARIEKGEVQIKLLDAQGKALSTQKKAVGGTTSITNLGDFAVQAPAKSGLYGLQIELYSAGKVISEVNEQVLVLDPPSFKDAMKLVCFLDEAESSSDAIKHISGKEKVIFTSSISSWNEGILDRLAASIRDGKTLFVSDMNNDDIEAFNSCSSFGFQVEGHFTTGANGASFHYLADQELVPHPGKDHMLNCTASAILPAMSLNELPNSTILARSVSIEEGELRHGVDVQIIPFGKGKIIFCQYALLDNLESNPLADQVFANLVQKG